MPARALPCPPLPPNLPGLDRVFGLQDPPLTKLEKHTERRDGRSYVSKDASWMKEPYEVGRGWYFEGCMSLAEKKKILHALPKLGCARQFQSHKPHCRT